MKKVLADFKEFYLDCKSQDFAFYMLAAYLVFSYMRPQVIKPELNFLPWTQISILAGLAYLLANKRLKLQASHYLVLLFALVATASSFQSFYPEYSFSKLDIPFIWFIEVIFFTNAVKNLHQFKLVVILFFLILLKISFFGAKTWTMRGFGFAGWGISGPPGFFANSGELSLLMAMLAVMSLGLILSYSKPNRLYYILPLTAVMTVMGASSRGGQLALLFGLLIINIFIIKIRFKSVVAVLFLAYVVVLALPEEQKARFTSMGDDGTSTSRIIYWKAGMEMMNDYPFLGVGYYAFPLYFEDNYSYLKEGGGYSVQKREVSHNSFVQVGSTLGYTGLAFYLGMILFCFSQQRKVRRVCALNLNNKNIQWCRNFSFGLDAALVTFLVGSFFMSVALYPYIYLMLMLSQATKNAVEQEVEETYLSNITS